MAEAVFFVPAELGHGFAQLGQKKDRVIAKAAGAAFFGDDLALAIAFEHLRYRGLLLQVQVAG